MIAIRLTYNGNVDWVYPFPLSFLPSWHSLGGAEVVLRGPGVALDRLHAICLHVGRSARVVDRTLMLHQVIHS